MLNLLVHIAYVAMSLVMLVLEPVVYLKLFAWFAYFML